MTEHNITNDVVNRYLGIPPEGTAPKTSAQPETVHLLRLNKKGRLECIEKGKAGKLERCKAFFGFGPLSMRNIAAFLQKHLPNSGINKDTKELLMEKIHEKALRYNDNRSRSRFAKKIEPACIAAISNQFALAGNGHSETGSTVTYADNYTGAKVSHEAGNMDFSHHNERLGYGFCLDGSGHSNPELKNKQEPVIHKFISDFEAALSEVKFTTVAQAQEWLQQQLKSFSEGFATAEFTDKTPALVFAQVVRIDGKRHLLTAHADDCTLAIKRKNGNIEFKTNPNPNNYTLGSSADNTIFVPPVHIHEVEQGDEIIGFTDGIGEFLSGEELRTLLQDNKDRTQLLTTCKQKIIADGQQFTGPRQIINIPQGNQFFKRAANQRKNHSCKYHHPVQADHDPGKWAYADDISLFCFTIK